MAKKSKGKSKKKDLYLGSGLLGRAKNAMRGRPDKINKTLRQMETGVTKPAKKKKGY